MKLYETDYCRWTVETARLLRQGRFQEVDVEHVVEELEDMGNSRPRELRARVMRILEHLIKLDLPSSQIVEYNDSQWRRAMARQRIEIEDLLKESPSLCQTLDGKMLAEAYRKARRMIQDEYGVNLPQACPYEWQDVLPPQEH